MKPVLATLAALLAFAPPMCAADEADSAKPPPPDLAAQKELLDEVGSFLRAARASLARWDQVPDQLGKVVYYAGVCDGAFGCGCCLIILYLLAHRRKTP